MAQYRPEYEVGDISKDGTPKYASIDRCPANGEIELAYALARRAGLWRFDERRVLPSIRARG